jgi:molybdopterin-biosynthesis enzyme MoeA-like protein
MAWLPEGGQPLYNPAGTAPGVLLKVGKTAVISLQGVSSELKAIVTHSLDAFLKDIFGQGAALSATIRVRCNDESLMEPVLSRVVADHPRVYIKSLATTLGKFPELEITLTVTGRDANNRRGLLETALEDLRGVEKTNIPILLVCESVFRVASMGTDNRYAPIDAP